MCFWADQLNQLAQMTALPVSQLCHIQQEGPTDQPQQQAWTAATPQEGKHSRPLSTHSLHTHTDSRATICKQQQRTYNADMHASGHTVTANWQRASGKAGKAPERQHWSTEKQAGPHCVHRWQQLQQLNAKGLTTTAAAAGAERTTWHGLDVQKGGATGSAQRAPSCKHRPVPRRRADALQLTNTPQARSLAQRKVQTTTYMQVYGVSLPFAGAEAAVRHTSACQCMHSQAYVQDQTSSAPSEIGAHTQEPSLSAATQQQQHKHRNGS